MLVFLAVSLPLQAQETVVSPGLYRLFAKMEKNQQVTVVAIGGSITMHTTGWGRRIAKHLQDAYPQAPVRFVNAGVSGTGSSLGVFRLQRDVLAHRPDLVLVEYAVNDGGTPDLACIRNLESIVTRLRKCVSQPAIVFVESASRTGGKLDRHHRVAAHYGLMSVDMQQACEVEMAREKLNWDDLLGDNVHPNGRGHGLYARVLWDRFQPYRKLPAVLPAIPKLPAPISSDGLILNGTMITPNYEMAGWYYKSEKIAGWWRSFFEGSLQSTDKAETLHIPFYGRTIGLWLLVKSGRGKIRIAVDGQMVKEMSAFRPNWFYNQWIHSDLLKPGWHVLSIIPIGVNEDPAKVRIGYILASDQTGAPAPSADFWQTTWVQSRQRTKELTKLVYRVIPSDCWQVLAPFGGNDAKPWEQPKVDLDRDYGVSPAVGPDTVSEFTGLRGKKIRWQIASGENGWVDLRRMTGQYNRGVAYADVTLKAPKAGDYEVRLAADYFVHIEVNGKPAGELMEPHGSPRNPVVRRLTLQEGENRVRIKIHAGSMGFGFLVEYSADSGLQVVVPIRYK
jgi:lysophospholipase L1-like esterase